MLRRTLEATGTTYDDYRYVLVHQVTDSYLASSASPPVCRETGSCPP